MKPTRVVWIVVHSQTKELSQASHAFGPFAGLAELAAWTDAKPDTDTCFKIALPLVVPDDATVVIVTAEDMVSS